MENRQKFLINVFRFDPGKDTHPRYERYEVPYDKGETILRVLNYITEHYDGSLGFRESCRGGLCAICTLRVNKKPILACQRTLGDFDDGEITIDPIRPDSVVRDLICSSERKGADSGEEE
jgi:succinate dehydrogenase/fumarate reductase iron-sulfur protein